MLQKHKAVLHFVGFFLVTIFGIGMLRSGQIANAQMALWGLMILQLSWGLLVFKPKNISIGRVKLALGVLFIVQLGQYGLNAHNLDRGVFNILDLVRYLIFIGLVEEIWFRGVLQDYLGKNTLKAIVAGAVIFGLYHLPHGWGIVLTTTAVGLLYTTARAYGAGILSLGLVHGVMNWMNLSFYPAETLRVDYSVFLILFPSICVLGSAGLYIMARKEQNL